MKTARIHPFCEKHNIGCYDGFRVCPRTITGKNKALYLHKSHFCLLWKSQRIVFIKSIKELKSTFKVIDKLYLTNMLKVLLDLNTNPKKSNLN